MNQHLLRSMLSSRNMEKQSFPRKNRKARKAPRKLPRRRDRSSQRLPRYRLLPRLKKIGNPQSRSLRSFRSPREGQDRHGGIGIASQAWSARPPLLPTPMLDRKAWVVHRYCLFIRSGSRKSSYGDPYGMIAPKLGSSSHRTETVCIIVAQILYRSGRH